jgi:propionyl-CoA carboxylase alpha chain
MIAKLCTWAPTREKAIDAMAHALDEFEVEGVGHNLPFLSAVMGNKRFRSGSITTGFIAEEFPSGFHGVEPDRATLNDLAAIATFVHIKREQRAGQISGTMENHQRHLSKDWIVTLAGQALPITITAENKLVDMSIAGGKPKHVNSVWQPGDMLGKFQVGTHDLAVKINITNKGIRLRLRGMNVVANVRIPRVAELALLMPIKKPKDTSKVLLCPMPGVVRAIAVAVGDHVEAAQNLAIVEAMKMENMLRAELKGKVKRIAATIGQSLAVDELIMEFE